MKSKFLKTLLAACLACASVIGLAACGGGGGGEGGSGGGGGVINEGKQLNYVLLDDGTYGVKVGECYDVPEITIPAKHEGKKVTTIMTDFFQVREQDPELAVKKIGNFDVFYRH